MEMECTIEDNSLTTRSFISSLNKLSRSHLLPKHLTNNIQLIHLSVFLLDGLNEQVHSIICNSTHYISHTYLLILSILSVDRQGKKPFRINEANIITPSSPISHPPIHNSWRVNGMAVSIIAEQI